MLGYFQILVSLASLTVSVMVLLQANKTGAALDALEAQVNDIFSTVEKAKTEGFNVAEVQIT